jgi:hypothetical protein
MKQQSAISGKSLADSLGAVFFSILASEFLFVNRQSEIRIPQSLFSLWRSAEIVAQQDAYGLRRAFAHGGAEMELAHGGDDSIIEAEACPTRNLDAAHLALTVNIDERIHRRFDLITRRRLWIWRTQTTIWLR